MNYETFTKEVLAELAARTGKDYEIRNILKNNGIKKDAIVEKNQDTTFQAMVYMDDLYKTGYSVLTAVDAVEKIYKEAAKETSRRDAVKHISDYDWVKDNIVVQVINAEKNAELLQDTPHLNLFDLAIIFRVVLSSDYTASVLVKDGLLDTWNVDLNELYQDAKANTKRLLGCRVTTIEEKMAELGFPVSSGEPRIYISSNEMGIYGAYGILYKDLLTAFSDRVKDDFYIIPSSVHELLLIPMRYAYDPEQLRDLVCSVNGDPNTMQAHEILSDQVYLFTRETGSLSVA